MAICGYCDHPGYHTQLIPPGAEPSQQCDDCKLCWQELDLQLGRGR